MSARGQGSIVRSLEINDPKIGAPPVREHVAELAHINNSATIRRDLRIDSILEVENVRGRQAIGFLLGHCAHLKDGKRDAGCQQNFFPGIKHSHSSASLGLKSGNLTNHTHWARKVFPSMQGRPGRKVFLPPTVPGKNADEVCCAPAGLGSLWQAGRPPSPAGQAGFRNPREAQIESSGSRRCRGWLAPTASRPHRSWPSGGYPSGQQSSRG